LYWLGRLDIPGLWIRWVPTWLTSLMIGTFCGGLGVGMRIVLNLFWPTSMPFGFLLPGILLATILGRFLAGLTCYVLGIGVSLATVRPNLLSAGLPQADADAAVVLYVVVGATMLIIAQAYRRSEQALRYEQVLRAETETDRQRLLAQELSHRIKNVLTTVQAIASQTLGKSDTPAEARDALDDRLVALGRAHDLLVETAWQPVPLSQIVADSVFAFDNGRFETGGPPLALPPRQAIALALALHELATNAIKYGALSVPEGRVAITWEIRGLGFRLAWTERDGPTVEAPKHSGFGTRLLQHNLASELGGQVTMNFAPSGFCWEISGPELH
jgi:two-component sensor histidine kinase